MAEKKAQAATVPTVPTAPGNSLDDFARFDRGLSEVLVGVKEDAPSGPVPPVSVPGFDTSVPTPAGTVPADLKVNPEEQALLAHRAMLRQEEERLARLPKLPPLYTGPVKSVVPSTFGGAQEEVVVRENADPLHVAAFRTLRRIVAGGSPLLAMVDLPALLKLIADLRDAIEFKPKDKVVVSS